MTQKFDDFMIWVPTKIFFGKKSLDHLAATIKEYGNRVLLVYGGGSIKENHLYDTVINILDSNDIFHCELSGVQPNPLASLIDEGLKIARDNVVDLVLPVGGGSVIDSAKAIAGAYYFDGGVIDFMNSLEGKPVETEMVLPTITILTLPATGSEMATGNTFVNDYVMPHIKAGFHGPYIRPRASFLNPEYMASLSAKHIAAGVSDIMSHILESYFSNEKESFMHARIAEGMLKTLIKYTPIALECPTDYEACANIMYCSSWGNNGYIVKGNYVSWSVHLLENPLNERFNVTHGEGLAILTPHWMRWAKRKENIYRYVELGVNVFGINPLMPDNDIADRCMEAIENFYFDIMRMPRRLRDLGVDKAAFEECAEKFARKETIDYQSMAFVPIAPSDALDIYNAAY